MIPPRYEGTGPSIQDALGAAHIQIPVQPHNDFTVSRVVDWGMQYGGFNPTALYWVIVEEDRNAPLRP